MLNTRVIPSFLATLASFWESTIPKPMSLFSRTCAVSWVFTQTNVIKSHHKVDIVRVYVSHPQQIIKLKRSHLVHSQTFHFTSCPAKHYVRSFSCTFCFAIISKCSHADILYINCHHKQATLAGSSKAHSAYRPLDLSHFTSLANKWFTKSVMFIDVIIIPTLKYDQAWHLLPYYCIVSEFQGENTCFIHNFWRVYSDIFCFDKLFLRITLLHKNPRLQ